MKEVPQTGPLFLYKQSIIIEIDHAAELVEYVFSIRPTMI